MTTAVEERPSHPLPHAAAGPKELPPFSFPAAPSTDTASPQQTPTQASFDSASIQRHAPTQAALEGQDASATTPAARSPTATAAAPRGHRHTSSLDSIDVTMGDDDDDQDSDNESVGSDSRPNKKKKSQRFYCTNYPPCNLSFTRSEHLARHIRKHTGERPFQCHCLRRFSRLDNLRQHAQTVHVNEDIPGDSLAATGTRFQRQIRTERMRPTAHRARASTLSTPGAHSRGHSRNMSSSSIGSIPDMGSPDDGRRRPQPLAMAHSPRHSLVVDTYAANSGSTESGQYQQPYYGYSPSGYSTPMSVFSHEASSPVGSTLQSPISFAPARSQAWEGRSIGHARRLSVPSQPTPTFHHMAPAPAYAAGPPQSAGAPPFSPTGSTFSGHAEAGQEPRSPENYLKRRTWHPSTYSAARPATSGLSYYQTPDTPQPVAATQPAAQQSIQLPGISSFFDRAQGQPAPPPRRRPSSHMMDIDEPPRQGSSDHATSAGGSEAGSKRNSWASVNQHFTQMEIAQTPPSSAHRPVTAPFGSTGQTAAGPQPPAHLPVQEPAPAVEPPSTPRRLKRQAWIGPSPSSAHDSAITPSGLRTSPEGSSSTSSVEALRTPITGSSAEYHPAIVHNHGYGEVHAHHHVVDDPTKAAGPPAPHFHPVPAPSHYEAPGPGKPMDRLDALVAVATQADESMRR